VLLAEEAGEVDGGGVELAGQGGGAAGELAVGVAEEGVEDAAVRISLVVGVGSAEVAAADDAAGQVDELDDVSRVGADHDREEGGRVIVGDSIEEDEVAEVGARGGAGFAGRDQGSSLAGEISHGGAVVGGGEGGVGADADGSQGGEDELDVGGVLVAAADLVAEDRGEVGAVGAGGAEGLGRDGEDLGLRAGGAGSAAVIGGAGGPGSPGRLSVEIGVEGATEAEVGVDGADQRGPEVVRDVSLSAAGQGGRGEERGRQPQRGL